MEYLAKPLINFNAQDKWTVDDAIKGTSIMGATGSGKTTASGKKLAHTFLKEGWGGLVLCAKNDEAKLWEEYCDDTGRSADRITFGRDSIHKEGDYKGKPIIFNPIDYELKREGLGAGETQNLANIFMNIYRLSNRVAGGEGDSRDERYWDNALKRSLNRTIELLKLAGEDLSYQNMENTMSSSGSITPELYEEAKELLKNGAEIPEIGLKRFYCLAQLLTFRDEYYEKNIEPPEEMQYAFSLVEDYFTNMLPCLDEKTQAIVKESFLGVAEPFLGGVLYKHFAGVTNIFPEQTYKENKIIILDFPIKEYLDNGIIGQCVFKQAFQQAVERRNTEKYPNPVFLWVDEAQYFMTPYDQLFLTTARSSRTATVFLSQNISNYLAILKKPQVDSLMGNLCTKVFHANSDTISNKYCSEMIGSTIRFMQGTSRQQDTQSLEESYSQSTGAHFLPQIQPKELTTLKTGGANNNYEVQGIITVNGKEWSNGKNYLKATFKQEFKTKT